ncbi:MAG TPA: nitrile hydratase accessory protein [Acidimicrobiales bacterium]|nr:nitrile hydratase accessory protein [Acidimicrobiales bacterium]
MPAPQPSAVLDVDGPAAPPRSNGELVFAEPWESRAFGLAMSLNASGVFDWEDFRRQLIAAVAEAEREATDDEPFSYYRCWLQALERVLDAGGVVSTEQLRARAEELDARPAGHDHSHGHGRGDEGHDHHH